ncbi:MAG: protein O-mannosyl-transferase [Verrucomicrobiota bacterium]
MTQANPSDLRFPQSRTFVLGLILVVGTIAIYWPAFHGGFIWDDDYYVTKNPLLTAPNGLWRIWFSLDSPSQYFPLVYTTFRFERSLWGLDPTGYHLVNIAFHVANALLVWRLLEKLKIPGAWLAAAIFAFHPVQVESVAWITERKNVLMGFFFLLTLLAWIRYVDLETKKRRIFYALALLFYGLALFSKTTACTLPAVLLLILWWRKEPINSRRLRQIAPFFSLAVVMGFVAIWWERFHQGTRGPLFSLGVIERVLVASHAIWFYLGKLFWPANLTFSYPRWDIHVADPFAYAWLLALGVACIAIYFARPNFGRGPEVAAIFFVATLGPMLGFIMLYTFRYTFVADHYQYLACIGPLALGSAGLTHFANRQKYSRSFLAGAAALILIPLAILTWLQGKSYSDIETLWRTTIARNPHSWMAYTNLGVARLEKGDIAGAIDNSDKALDLYPDYAEAHYNLGNALLKKGEIDQALAHCERAVALMPNEPDSHIALGNALLAKNDVDQAIAHYSRALALDPERSTAQYALGNALVQKGDATTARFHFEKAAEIEPQLAEAHIQLGNIALKENDARAAIAHYEHALRASPDSIEALNNLAWLLASSSESPLRNGAKAVKLAEHANGLSHASNVIVLHTLAAAYAENNQFDRAIETARLARRLAIDQRKPTLADQLDREIALYQSGAAYREP